MNNAVEFHGVSVRRGKNDVVHNVDLVIPSGQLVGLLGPSGAGKSSLMRSLVGVQAGVSGTITVLGSPAGSPALATRVAYDTQSASVFDDLTVRQNLEFARAMLGCDTSRIDEVLVQVNLTDYAGRRVDALSGGQRSRVSLATALLANPDVLVLDEPTVGLDPVLRDDLWGLFRNIVSSRKTILVSSHVMDEATRCDRLVFMRDGRIIADGTLAEIEKSTNTKSAEDAFLVLARREGTE